MAQPLAPEQRAAYSAIIDQILNTADLNTISANEIRKRLQAKVHVDLTPQKKSIKELVLERFDRAEAAQSAQPTVEPEPTANGYVPPPTANITSTGIVLPSKPAAPIAPTVTAVKPPPSPPTPAPKRKASSSDDELRPDLYSAPSADTPPAAKKAKKLDNGTVAASTTVDEDARIAARLQAEYFAAARETRGGGTKRRNALTKKDKKSKTTTKKKSAAKVRDDDDSGDDDEDGEKAEKPEKERKGGFHKLMALSEPLAAMVGEPVLSRPQTVKRIWDYVKARSMQDPSDKRIILCDDAMRAVFKQDKVHMFTMNKLLAHHLHPADEVEL